MFDFLKNFVGVIGTEGLPVASLLLAVRIDLSLESVSYSGVLSLSALTKAVGTGVLSGDESLTNLVESVVLSGEEEALMEAKGAVYFLQMEESLPAFEEAVGTV